MNPENPLTDAEALEVLGIESEANNFVNISVTEELRQFSSEIHTMVSTMNLEGAMDAIDQMIECIRNMDIAEHYSSTKTIGTSWANTSRINPLYATLTEAEFKRVQLIRKLETLKGDVGNIIVRARAIIADALMAQRGFAKENMVSSSGNETQ